MSLFAISDTHLSFDTDKSMTVFNGWNDYTARLKKNWNSVVEKDDFVVIGGDISWAMNFPQLKKDFDFINKLNGKKIILKGNHDYWWNTMSKMNAFIEENGFESISILHNNAYLAGDFALCGSRGWFFDRDDADSQKVLNREVGRLKTSINCGKKLSDKLIVFLHYPPLTTSGCCEEMLGALKEENISRCFYGHLHADGARYSINREVDGIKFSLISADYLKFCPKLIEKF